MAFFRHLSHNRSPHDAPNFPTLDRKSFIGTPHPSQISRRVVCFLFPGEKLQGNTIIIDASNLIDYAHLDSDCPLSFPFHLVSPHLPVRLVPPNRWCTKYRSGINSDVALALVFFRFKFKAGYYNVKNRENERNRKEYERTTV